MFLAFSCVNNVLRFAVTINTISISLNSGGRGASRIFYRGCLKIFFLVNERSELASEKRMAQLGKAVCPLMGDLGFLRSETTNYLIVVPFT